MAAPDAGTSSSVVTDLLVVAVILVVSYAVGWLIAYFVRKLWLRPRKVELSTELLVTRSISYSIMILGSLVAMRQLGIDITALVMGLGVAGLAVAFGVQEIVSNFVSGVIIMVDRPVRVGDVVEVEGASGEVVDVGLRASTIRTLDNVNVLVPNRLIVLNKIVNYSKHDPRIRLRVSVGVAYGSDLEKVRGVLLSVAGGHSGVLSDPAPEVRLVGFGDSSVDFVLFVWIDDPSLRFRIRDELNWEIGQRFRAEGITIPFPQVEVWMRKS